MIDHTHEYDENCPGCQPAILDLQTNKPLPDDHPYMAAALRAFKSCTMTQRRAWHRVVIQQSKNETDLKMAAEVGKIMAEEVRKCDPQT